MSSRDEAVARLSEEVFSRGNVHLKNVTMLTALPEGLHSFPEVCFIGKPNSGKSSIISCLLHNQRLGRWGQNRGTTRALQFFNVGDALLLVDTPGYGGWKGRHLSQSIAERATAFAILFRYLSIRKYGALKRVYWVMEAERSIQPRDEELLYFLREENIPFSVIVSKVDRFHGDASALQHHISHLWDFFGTDEVPVLGVRASPRYPERCINMTALQNDITHYCTQEITRLEDMNYKSFKELSYAPPTAEEISVVERRYPIESFILPEKDNLSLERFVAMHENAKAHLLASAPQAARLSTKEMIENHLFLDGKGESDEGSDEGFLVETCSAIPVATCGTESRKNETRTYTSTKTDSAVSGNARVSQRHFNIRGSLRRGLLDALDDGFHLDFDTDDTTSKQLVGPVNEEIEESLQIEVKFSERDNPSSTPLVPPRVVNKPLPPSLDSHTHSVRAINGVLIPKSMITISLEQLAASQEGSFENFVRRTGTTACDGLMNVKTVSDEVFLELNEVSRLSENEQASLQRPVCKSARKKQLEQMLRKYVERKRKERSIQLHAQGYMCPWLSGAGPSSRGAVVGLAFGQSSIARGGSLMKGLKRTGFGGMSYSANTLKNRGRATKKVGFWAA